MSILYELPGILSEARREYSRLLKEAETAVSDRHMTFQNDPAAERPDSEKYSDKPPGEDRRARKDFVLSDFARLSNSADENFGGYFEICDNAIFLAEHIADGTLKNGIDLIYIDPPFFSEVDQGTRIKIKSPIYDEDVTIRLTAYKDTWRGDMSAYLFMLAVRLMLMRDALKPTGSIFVHLDWHAVHAVKLIMDEIFGEENFVNEIVWTYKSGGAAKRHFSRKHDTILFYSKTDRYKFRLGKEKSYNRGFKPYRFKGVEEFQDEIGWYTMVNQKDVWQIDMVGRSSSERLNYATQKPEALLERIIDSVTEEGDLAADFFCGSGTLAAAAAKAGRRFICTDISSMAVANAIKRPLKEFCRLALKAGIDRSGADTAGCTADLRRNNGTDAARYAPDFSRNGTDTAGHTAGFVAECASEPVTKAAKEAAAVIEAVWRDEAIHIISYKNDGMNAAIAGGQRKGSHQSVQLSELLEKDSLAFVDYWGIGFMDESSGIFYPEKAIFRDKRGNLKTSMKINDDEAGHAVIFAADIFGNIIFTRAVEC